MSCTPPAGPQTPTPHPAKKISSPSENDPPTRLHASSEQHERAQVPAVKLNSEWTTINQALKARALSSIKPIPLKLDGTIVFMGRHADDLAGVLHELVAQYNATRIDQAVASEISELHARISNESLISNEMAKTIEDLRQEIASIKHQNAMEMATAQANLVHSNRHREKIENELSQTTLALKEAKGAISAQLREIAHLKACITDMEHAEAKHKTRNEAIFTELMHRRVHMKASIDRKVLDVIDIYEAKVASMARKLEESTAPALQQPAVSEISRQESRDDKSGQPALDLDTLVLAVKQAEASKRAAVTLVEEKERAIEKLEFENQSLRLELQARPSLALWRQTRDRLQRVEAAIASACKTPVSAEARESSKLITATESRHGMAGSQTHREIEKDKSYYRLGLYKIDEAAADICREHLKSICRKFSVKGLEDLPAAIEKMSVMMELMGEARSFTARMARLANATEPASASSDRIGDLIEAKVRLLDEALLELESYRAIEQKLCRALECSPADIYAQAQSLMGELTRIKCVASRWERSDAILSATASHPSLETDHLAEILGHIQLLFDVPSLAGLLPRMSEVYAHWMELQNAMSAMRSVLSLPASLPASAVVKTIAERFEANKRE